MTTQDELAKQRAQDFANRAPSLQKMMQDARERMNAPKPPAPKPAP